MSATVVRRNATARAARLEQAVLAAVGLSWTAALIHAVVVPEHWHEYRPYAVAFAVLAVLQAGWSAAFFRAPSGPLLRLGALLSAPVVAVWALSRTTGLPLGPEAWSPEPVGVLDVAATAIELLLVGAGLRYARAWPDVDVPAWALRLAGAAVLFGGVALTVGAHHH